MSKTFDVAVIGAGGLGLSVALQAALNGKSVVLLDRADLGGQTSPRAAGLSCQMKTDSLQRQLTRDSNHLFRTFATWACGVELTVHQAGALKIARTPKMAESVAHELESSRLAGVESHFLSPREAQELAPYYEFADDPASIAYTPTDLYLDPQELISAYIAACKAAGVELRPGEAVLELRQRNHEICSIESTGLSLEAGAVVDTAGGWIGLVADLIGFRVPVVPVRHQLCVTEPDPGINNAQPAIRVAESNVYMRPDRGGLMFGGYEPEPLQVDRQMLEKCRDVAELALDFAPLRALMKQVDADVPLLRDPKIREFRGGIPTMTADGNFLIDAVPGVRNFFVVGGCNVSGLSTSPAIGQLVSRLIDGEPGMDLSSASLSRFNGRPFEDLRSDALWRYAAREQWD